MKKILGLFILGLAVLACVSSPGATPEQANVETVVAATLESMTALAPPATQVNGTLVTADNISFVIPTGIGNGAETNLIEAVAPSEGMPWWEVAPTYHKFIIQEYVWQNAFHKPAVYVYPVAEYIQLNEDVGKRFDELKAVLSSSGQSLPEKLPFLPTFNATQVFYSNPQLVSFQSGTAIRYVTQYAQAPLPISNAEVFYTFQGLTSDGKYYVSAVLPINHPLLVADATLNAVTPNGGVPFEWDPEKFELLPAYVDSVTQLLNTADPNSFNPTLPLLDQFMQSIKVVSQ